MEKQLNRQKEEGKLLQKEVNVLKRQLKLEAMKAKSATRRAIRNAPAYGWQSAQSLSEELRAMKTGCRLEMLSSSGTYRPEVRYVKVRDITVKRVCTSAQYEYSACMCLSSLTRNMLE